MNRKENVWIVDDDQSIRWVLERALEKAGMEVSCFSNAGDLLDALGRYQPDVVVSDIRMPGMDGLTLLDRIVEQHEGLPVIIMTAHSDLDSAVSSFHGGAFEYLPKPFDIEEAVTLVKRAATQNGASLAEAAPEPSGGADEEAGELLRAPEIIGESAAMQEVFRAIGRLARSSITVLINGESGTGKELVAKALHRHGPRSDKPFIALNMAAIPRDLLEAELFGHERGAFTGAQARRAGRFEQANGGTLFLDEIGDMPAELQTRLLRVLAEGEFFTVGGHTPVKVDVRIVAATHQPLEKLVEEGRFREDLYHRLNVIPIHLPALRERREDIPQLAGHFLFDAASDLGVPPKELSPEAAELLQGIDWPGNVRQLENVCRRLTVMAPGRTIRSDDLPPDLQGQTSQRVSGGAWDSVLKQWADRELLAGHTRLLDEATPRFERTMLEAALGYTGGRRQDAARLLGWGRNTLTRKLKELGMDSASDPAGH